MTASNCIALSHPSWQHFTCSNVSVNAFYKEQTIQVCKSIFGYINVVPTSLALHFFSRYTNTRTKAHRSIQHAKASYLPAALLPQATKSSAWPSMNRLMNSSPSTVSFSIRSCASLWRMSMCVVMICVALE